ncbi:hypothetical protein C463_05495 [Halorubrum californiense DSM 19288]|uniref:Nucleotide modification associated domain-containing protein n=1 Tax=Halorubrum californiense DSM 19288 TaxID=1227465 RepID=M0EHG8_9EURY|nr:MULTISPECIES: hypothetical protein [Halorubrum]ELZ45859.1 hypothetical protein C463_05495 [Halorubrum californiense DSM 19288]TKX69634.1 hypothetical protein EXE40_10590 [Halorubrum sp. GN11GM_10-3_MGM]
MPGPRAVAVNVAANTNEPGFRGPVYPDGSFAYVPIPESAATLSREGFPVDETLPTYGDLDLPFAVPAALRETPVHADPEFPRVHGRERATYGDPHGVKAGRIAALDPGDWLLFYATLSLRPRDWAGPGAERPGDEGADDRGGAWLRERGVDVDDDLAPDWGAYLFAGIRIERVLSAGDDGGDGAVVDRAAAAAAAPTNAHLKRDPFDARAIAVGDPAASGPFDRVVPLSASDGGSEANRLVTDLSSDSGKGPWWRRPMAFDAAATSRVLERIDGI